MGNWQGPPQPKYFRDVLLPQLGFLLLKDQCLLQQHFPVVLIGLSINGILPRNPHQEWQLHGLPSNCVEINVRYIFKKRIKKTTVNHCFSRFKKGFIIFRHDVLVGLD